jgi:hypothetical protein
MSRTQNLPAGDTCSDSLPSLLRYTGGCGVICELSSLVIKYQNMIAFFLSLVFVELIITFIIFIHKLLPIYMIIFERNNKGKNIIETFIIHNAPLLLTEAYRDWTSIQTYYIRGNNGGKWRSWCCRGEVAKVFIMQDLCLITDRQTHRQGTNPLVFNLSLVSLLFHSRILNGFERCNQKILADWRFINGDWIFYVLTAVLQCLCLHEVKEVRLNYLSKVFVFYESRNYMPWSFFLNVRL